MVRHRRTGAGPGQSLAVVPFRECPGHGHTQDEARSPPLEPEGDPSAAPAVGRPTAVGLEASFAAAADASTGGKGSAAAPPRRSIPGVAGTGVGRACTKRSAAPPPVVDTSWGRGGVCRAPSGPPPRPRAPSWARVQDGAGTAPTDLFVCGPAQEGRVSGKPTSHRHAAAATTAATAAVAAQAVAAPAGCIDDWKLAWSKLSKVRSFSISSRI